MLAVRADDGVLRAFRNVCVHRGARLLEEGTGHCRVIQCPYHHWMYGLDGTLKRTPWFGEDPDFDMADWPLQSISVEEWRGLLFVAIDPMEPLLANLGDTVGILADEPIETFQLYRTERLVFDANWKIYVDNFIEGYHIPGIHPSFYAAIDFEKFETVAMDNVIKMTAPPKNDLFYRGTWLTTWPNLTLSLFDGGMNTSRVNPIDEVAHRVALPLLLRRSLRLDEGDTRPHGRGKPRRRARRLRHLRDHASELRQRRLPPRPAEPTSRAGCRLVPEQARRDPPVVVVDVSRGRGRDRRRWCSSS